MTENTDKLSAALRGLEPTDAARARGLDAAMAAFEDAFAAENLQAAQGSAAGARPTLETPGPSGVRDFGTKAMSHIRDFFSPRHAMMGGTCAAALIAALVVFRSDPGLYELDRPVEPVEITADVEAPTPTEPAIAVTPPAADSGSESATVDAADDASDPSTVPAPPTLEKPAADAPSVDKSESVDMLDITADTPADTFAESPPAAPDPAPASPPPPPAIERTASADAPSGGGIADISDVLGTVRSDSSPMERARVESAPTADAIVVTGSRGVAEESGAYTSGLHFSKRTAAPASTAVGEPMALSAAVPEFESETRRVLKTPARTVERRTPAVTRLETRRIENPDGTVDTVTETVVVAEASTELITLPPVYEDIIVPPRPQPEPQSGQLTAGDYDDVLNPDLYKIYTDRMLQGQLRGKDLPHIDANRRIAVSVTDRRGRPLPLADVTLRAADGSRMFPLKTGADGKVWLYPGYDGLEAGTRIEVRANGRTRTRSLSNNMIERGGEMTLELDTRAKAVEQMDLLLTIDATGSMSDELRYLQTELQAILRRVEAAHPGIDIRTGLIVYRDVGDAYVVREVPFTADMDAFQAKLMAQVASGGGDAPEAMHTALSSGLDMDWRDGALKVNLLVADAPPHDRHIGETWDAALESRTRGIHMVPLAASGVDKTAEFVMRGMAQITAGRFLFLTDDSGIGNPHAEPTVDCYIVTRLDGLVSRVLNGLIGGERVEPRPGEVIRSVGNYDAGVCDVSDSIVRTVNQQQRQ